MKKIFFLISIILFAAATQSFATDPTSDAIGKWVLANTTYTDSSGNGYNLTGSGTPTAAAGHSGGTNLSTHFVATSSQYLYLSDASCGSLKITGNITISAWVYPSATGVYHIIVAKFGGSGSYGYEIQIANTNIVRFFLSNNGTTLTYADGATALSASTWYHICAVYNGTDMRVYINGVLDSNGASNPKAYTSGIYNTTADFCISSRSSGATYSTTSIDDVVIWNRALTAEEVAFMYSSFLDDFTSPYFITGTLRDTAGNAIDCSTYNVRMNTIKISVGNAVAYSFLNTSADGTFSIPVITQDPYLIEYHYYGNYTPTNQSNIAGAEIMVGE